MNEQERMYNGAADIPPSAEGAPGAPGDAAGMAHEGVPGTSSEKAFCVNCGAEIQDGAAFCPRCGQKVGEKISLPVPAQTYRKAPGINKAVIGGIAGVVVLIAAVVIFFAVRGVQAKDVTLSKKELSVKVGETATLSFTIDPGNTKDKSVTWSSSNGSIAQVTDGTVTGVNEGDCTITVTTKNGKSDLCEVTVVSAGPDLQGIYNEYCTASFAEVASDGSYLTVDTNPFDIDDHTDYEAYQAIVSINEALGLPESVLNRMVQTRSMDGIQSYSTDDLDITWTYHPDRGLEVNYSKK